MLSATKAYLCNAFMTWTQISITDTSPSWFSEIERQEDPSAKWERLQLHLGKFVDEFVMTEFDIEKSWREELEQRRQQRQQQLMSRSSNATSQTLPTEESQSAMEDTKTPGVYRKLSYPQCIELNLGKMGFFYMFHNVHYDSAIRNFCSLKNKIKL